MQLFNAGEEADMVSEFYQLKKLVRKKKNYYDFYAKAWCWIHHTFLYLSIIFGTAAAAVLELKRDLFSVEYGHIGALLAIGAGLVGTLSLRGGFERKWKTMRISRTSMESLLVDMTDSDVDLDKVRDAYKDVLRAHDKGIIGDFQPEHSDEEEE